MITLLVSKALRPGNILHSVTDVNSNGTPIRFKVNGMPKLWKRNWSRVRVPLKHGLYNYGYLTNGTFEGGGFTVSLNEVTLAF